MTSHTYYVLHSPYPDKTWRGVEKCASSHHDDTPLLFDSEETANAFIEERGLSWFTPVEVCLITPDVRKKI